MWVPEMSGCYCLFLFLPSLPVSTYNSSSLPASNAAMSPYFPVLMYLRLTLVVKRGDSRQTLTMFLGWENIILTINCSRHSTIKPFHAVSCGGLPANSGKISIHEPTYTSLFVLFALCCVPTINLVPEAATFNGLDTSCFVNVCVHV